ncbi:MAG: NirD/YgiW/YdeI family stress tolerance protein [Treponema sp.]|nr:NirD/YgiW/YdeI family stress tolerance protein [Treponema sp.]MCL2272043.1 NirD/YgiW/YdeI family stress tolerance protein [Treponema sp.]MCL2272816.1 NirD/YgiW/YdeI family stress tolerance protein [Treponema sp.]
MKKYTMLLILCFVLFLSAGSVFAQMGTPGQFGYGFSGPQATMGQFGYGQLQTVTVNQARTLGHKIPVVMTGNLVQFYGGKDLYVFRDASGEILVKIGPKEWQNLWYQGISIDPSNTIEIFGEVHWPKHNWGTPEVHVRFIKKV